MESAKDLLELLGKAKNLRLSVATFIVSFVVLFLARDNYFVLGEALEGILKVVVLVTASRMVYGVIGLLVDLVNKHQEKRKKKLEEDAAKAIERKTAEEALEVARVKARALYEQISSEFGKMDVFQLAVIESLKKVNHTNVDKGATLFSLKKAGIVHSVASGERTESVALTAMANEFLNEEGWRVFDGYKYKASARLFRNMNGDELEYFCKFLQEDVIVAEYKVSGLRKYYASQKYYGKYAASSIFVQPQRDYRYSMDPIAKAALMELQI